jgi:hypothetical protein
MKNIIKDLKDYTFPVGAFSFFVVSIICIINLSLPYIKSIPFLNGSLSNITQAVVLFCTGVDLVIYTYETKKLREASHEQIRITQNQTEIQQRPFVIFETIDVGINEPEASPSFRNIGNGIAFNIKIRGGSFKIQKTFIDVDGRSRYKDAYEFIYDVVGSMLQKGEPIRIDDASSWKVESIEENFPNPNKFAVLYAKYADTLYRTIIEFQNIEMKWYYVEQVTSREGTEIINSGPLLSAP